MNEETKTLRQRNRLDPNQADAWRLARAAVRAHDREALREAMRTLDGEGPCMAVPWDAIRLSNTSTIHLPHRTGRGGISCNGGKEGYAVPVYLYDKVGSFRHCKSCFGSMENQIMFFSDGWRDGHFNHPINAHESSSRMKTIRRRISDAIIEEAEAARQSTMFTETTTEKT